MTESLLYITDFQASVSHRDPLGQACQKTQEVRSLRPGVSCRGQSSPCGGTDRGPPHGHRSAEALRPLLEGWAAAGKTPARGGLGEGTTLVPVSLQSPQSHDWEPSMFFRDLPSFCS